MIQFDSLRPPGAFDPSAPAYKDWLHLNLFDHASGVSGLLNLSLHGPPGDPRALAVAAVLVHVPERGWIGGAQVFEQSRARLLPNLISGPGAALAVHHASGTVHASADDRAAAPLIKCQASAEGPAHMIDQPLPLGSGWIAWYVVPRLRVTGTLAVGRERFELSRASAYHDHNWGRWHWGEDFGWDWVTFCAERSGFTVVYGRTSDRRRQLCSPAWLLLRIGAHERRFPAARVRMFQAGRYSGPVHRVPGAMAAFRQDRARPHLPARVQILAGHQSDQLQLDFSVHAAAQIINSDPVIPGQSFIHELAGHFRAHGRMQDRNFKFDGPGVFEHVD